MHNSLKYKTNLEAKGWTSRFITCEPRLSEAADLYREAGFDVLLVKFPLKKAGISCPKKNEKYGCRECFHGVEEKYRIIYTRPKKRTS